MSTLRIDPSNPRWFPVDLNVPERRYGFLRVEDGVLERSSFLDTRMDAPLNEAIAVAADSMEGMEVSSGLAWLFHTSFCGSTLLARVLHSPPSVVCLREPMVLRRLGDARDSGQVIDFLLPQAVALLSRPWYAGSRVVVKPTHAALNIAANLLEASPGSRGLVLTSSLGDFLVSNLKKTPDSQAKIPHLAERAMKASGLHQRLPQEAFQPPDILCAAVLQWAAQREVVADIIAMDQGNRVRVLDMQSLLDDLPAAAAAASEWLALDLPPATLEQRCRIEGNRNAKATEAPYSATRRAEESRFVASAYSDALRAARNWADAHILPFMRPQATQPSRTLQ